MYIYIDSSILNVISIDCYFHKLSETGKISVMDPITNYLEPKNVKTLNKIFDRIRPPLRSLIVKEVVKAYLRPA